MPDFLPLLRTPVAEKDATMLNPLVLAFVGDSVQTLYERTLSAFTLQKKPHELHVAVSSSVNAKAQSEALRRIEASLTETENAVFHRARNSKTQTSAKNASIADYRVASGYEAVLGFLYLTGNTARLDFLLNAAYGRTAESQHLAKAQHLAETQRTDKAEHLAEAGHLAESEHLAKAEHLAETQRAAKGQSADKTQRATGED